MLPAAALTRAAAGAAVPAGSLVPHRRDRIGRREQKAFRLVNHPPGPLYVPTWPIMQLGALGAAPVTAAVALAAGNRPLAGRLVRGGTAAWVWPRRSSGWSGGGGR